MISIREISKIAGKDQVSMDTVEKDYVISWILICFAKSAIVERLHFHGGTAIKRIYFDDHRYSEDIDFVSFDRLSEEDICSLSETLKYAQEKVGVALRFNPERMVRTRGRLQVFVEYDGFDEISGSAKEIKVDFMMNCDGFGHVERRAIIPSYSDIHDQKGKLNVLTLNTILANKLGMLFDVTRHEPRDLFDIWFLLNRVRKFDFDAEQVLLFFKTKYSFMPLVDDLCSKMKSQHYATWEKRLSKQVAYLPTQNQVTEELVTLLNVFTI